DLSPRDRICTRTQVEDHRGCGARHGSHDPRVFPFGLGVHAPTRRRCSALHAHDPAGHVDHASQPDSADAGQGAPGFPRSRTSLRKSWTSGTRDRPGPFLNEGTVVVLKPHMEWPKKKRWYSSWAPEWMQRALRRAWPDHKNTQELIYGQGGLNDAMQFPGISNAWTMPIKARNDMLTTGVRTSLGIKILGSDLSKIEEIGENIEMALKGIRGTTSVFAERTAGGYFLDFDLKRDALARYGITVGDAEEVLMSAVGGENVTTTVEGRERYPVNVRYLRNYRSDIGAL